MLARAQLTIRNEKDWEVSATPPSNPTLDTLWMDTSVTPHTMKRWNGSTWVTVGADLGNYYTKTELETRFEQTDQAIALKANSTVVTALTTRITTAEQKITPAAIVSTVRTNAQYQYDLYHGRNYVLQSHGIHMFVDNLYRYASGATTTYTGFSLPVSDDLFPHSGNAAQIRMSFDIKRTNLASTHASSYYTGVWVYYRYLGEDGVTVYTTGRGWYLRTTDTDFASTDSDWVRVEKGPLNLTSYSPISIAYFQYGSGLAGVTGTVQFRNVKLEVGNEFTGWSAAPEDLGDLPGRMVSAESSITQNASNIALKVSTSLYNTEKVYRSATAPASPSVNMLWLNTGASPYLLSRWTGSAWVAAGTDKVIASGINITPNDITLRTTSLLLQLLDPANNENVLMEMRANGLVGFKELYAEKIVSPSVVPAYSLTNNLYISTVSIGNYYNVFYTVREAVEFVNGMYLKEDVTITFWSTSSETVYDNEGILIEGVSGPGTLIITGLNKNKVIHSYVRINNCSALVELQYLSIRDSRPMLSGGYHPALIYARHNSNVKVTGCTLNCNNVSHTALMADFTQISFANSQVTNAYCAFEVRFGMGTIESVRGNPVYAIQSDAAIVFGLLQLPTGTLSRVNNGLIYTSGTTTSTGNTTVPTTPDQSVSIPVSLTRSYRGGWRTDTNDLVQGLYSSTGYSSSLSWNYGCMWFGTLRSLLSGRTIRSATLTLQRKAGGTSGATVLTLYGISNTTASGTIATTIAHGRLGSINLNSTIMYTIPVSVVQRLANGTDGGLAIYETPYNFGSSAYSSNYCRMSGTDGTVAPILNVVYA